MFPQEVKYGILPRVKLDRHILSNEAGPFAQFIKYGIVGVMATCVQTGIFYILAATGSIS